MDIRKISKQFKAVADNTGNFTFQEELNGFSFPVLPVITNQERTRLELSFEWGLVPAWCKDDSIRKNTLNARIESLDEKPAFRSSVTHRCLVIATGYFEWRWLDEKGKSKQKFEVHHAVAEAFAFAGLYASWQDPFGKRRDTFTICTTQANPQMQYVHNTKNRMPVMLNPGDEDAWLDPHNDVRSFAYPEYSPQLVAFPIS